MLADLHLIAPLTVPGLALGGVYALAATGLVLIYRVSGVLNFAHGAVAMFATFIAYQVSIVEGLPAVAGLVAALVAGALIGFIIEYFTIRPLTGRPALTKVAITIGWLLVLQTGAGLIWGDTNYHLPVEVAPTNGFNIPIVNVIVGFDQLTIFLVAIGLSLGVAAVLKYTTLGASMRAVADDPASARLWGINVNRVTAASWMIGSAMAAVAGVLITPLINFNTYSLTLIVIYAFTPALIGRLISLPWTLVGAIALGLAQQWPTAFTSNGGINEVAAFVLVLIALVVIYRPGVGGARLRLRAA
ncbi:MAG: branched-chain amino acid ABC transporter permease [Chloroflexi bacterium]|nr:MAG: branched-chain amino acid ABC transporter permease [Chloroflexota bacterium]